MTARAGTVLTGVLRSRQRSILLWALAVSAVAAMYTAFYPTIGGVKMNVMLEAMPPAVVEAMGLDAMASAAGYVGATVYSLLGAVLVLVLAIGSGARTVGGHEEDGTLELELAAAVSRATVYAERLLALWIEVVVVVSALTVVLMLMSGTMDLDLDPANIVAASTAMVVFAGTLGTVAFAVGAATGRRAIGLGAASGLAVLAYLFNYLGPLADVDWMTTVSPFHWYVGEDPLVNGFNWGGMGLLAALAAVAVGVGALRFARRDVMV